jgi:hypothetical protein
VCLRIGRRGEILKKIVEVGFLGVARGINMGQYGFPGSDSGGIG